MKYAIPILIILGLLVVFVGGVVNADPPVRAPHRGVWTAVDVDDSNMRLIVAGGGRGVYHLVWQDDYWSICDGRPGIGRAIGTLNPSDSNVLNTKLSVYCTGRLALAIPMDFTYYPATDTMINTPAGSVTWSRR